MTRIEHFNSRLEPFARWHIRRAYKNKLQSLIKANPQLFKARAPEQEDAHRKLWKPMGMKVSIGWFRFFANLHDYDDPRFVPDDIYHVILERILNDLNYAWVFADKNFYQRHLPGVPFPRTFLRNIAGTFADEDYGVLSEKQARSVFENCPEELIAKPALDSCSGNNVRLLRKIGGIWRDGNNIFNWEVLKNTYGTNWLIQERLHQHSSLSSLNPSSINSLRIFTYKSLSTNEVHATTSILRIGRKGLSVDNMNAGGLVCGVDQTGRLSSFAIDEKSNKHEMHPDSGQFFTEMNCPFVGAAKKLCIDAAQYIFSQRTLSFDVAILENGKPCLIEINTWGQGAHMSQFFDGPLFGKFTDEVIDYARDHIWNSKFKLFRLQG